MRLTVAVALFAAAATLMDGSILHAASRDLAPSRESAEPAPSQARASDRRRTFVGVVGFAALVLGLSGLWLVRRSRRHTPDNPAPDPVEPRPVVARIQTLGPPVQPSVPPSEGLMLCPTCRAEYTGESRFCKLDGNRLVAVREGADSRGPAGGVCPVCEQGFDPGVASCPVHDEELVPAGAHHAQERPSGQYPKICPTCGVQYPTGSGFCDADGSALVTVN